MTLQLHRPDGQGGLIPTPAPEAREDWRKALRSPRWSAARLRNTEMNPTSTAVAVGFWVFLAGITFLLLLAGYGTHFWH